MTKPTLRLFQCVLLLSMLTGEYAQTHGQDATPPEKAKRINLRVTGGGSFRYAPGHWGVVNARVINPGDDTSVRCVSWFEGDSALRFGREITVPRESVRQSWYSVQAPAGNRSARSLEFVYGNASADGNAVASEAVETDLLSLIVPVSRPRVLYANDREPAELAILSLLSAARSQMATTALLNIFSETLPPVEEAWDIADLAILSADRIGHDSLAQAALQAWVRRGGNLWIPLDLIDPDIVTEMFGDRLQMDVVNRTSVTAFRVMTEPPLPEIQQPELKVEQPIDFVRVVVDGVTVTHRLDDWPAAFNFQFGRGKVTVTTLGLGAWIVAGSNLIDQSTASRDKLVHYTPAASSLFSPIFGRVVSEPFAPAALDEYVTSRIGYQTPGRSTIAWLLGLHATICLAVARWLRRTSRPAWILWTFPLLGGIAAALLIMIGSSSRSQPPGQQIVQIVESEDSRSELIVSGSMAFYSDMDETPVLGTETGAVFLPDRRGMEQARWTFMRSDAKHWQLENVAFRPGVRTAQFSTRITTPTPIRMTGTFDASGFSGHLETPFHVVPEDVLIADRTHETQPVAIASDGRVEPAGDILPPGEFLNSTVVSEEQTRRQRLYRELFRAERRNDRIVKRPTLLFWTRPLDLKTGKLNAEPAQGAALFIVPVEIERPPVGTTLRIPSPFIPYRAIPSPGEHATPAFFSNVLGTWSEYPHASKLTLRFQLPQELLPLASDKATLTLKITAPLRDVSIVAIAGDRETSVADYSSPVGVLTTDIDGAAYELDARGGLMLRLTVSDVASDSADSAIVQDRYWKIDWLRLECVGRTL